MQSLTPRQIVAELDRYIVGQDAAKRAVAIALRNRYRRSQLPEEMREDVIPKNILMIGPTGVGKTEIARRLAKLANAPFVKVEASKFTEVGYVGRDVDSMVRDLMQTAVRLVREERAEAVRPQAEANAEDRLLDLLLPRARRRADPNPMKAMQALFGGGAEPEDDESDESAQTREEQMGHTRERLKGQLAAGGLEARTVEVEVEEASVAFMPVFGQGGMEEMGMNLQDMLGNMAPKRKKTRKTTVKEARRLLIDEEAQKLIDMDEVVREATDRAEQHGIIFLDEVDKIAGHEGTHGPDVSREGVQRDILPIIEGSAIITKYGAIRTNYVLFIAAGAFHVSKPSDLIPELQGRLPIRVELDSLTEDNFRQILTEPQNALTKQYIALMETEGVTLSFTEDGIAAIARTAAEVNAATENIGARRLHTIMERLLEELSFEAPDAAGANVVINAAYVRQKLASIAGNEDLSRYIL
ncbi:MAG TPA: ATP-dependent protease ATPase subunit HslU [Armatimonadota bacterium]|jgi:ATP-dependent HslUV protease ATP-binding subunit HslU